MPKATLRKTVKKRAPCARRLQKGRAPCARRLGLQRRGHQVREACENVALPKATMSEKSAAKINLYKKTVKER